MIPLSRPDITQDDIDAVLAVLQTPSLSMGPWLDRFEQLVASYTGCKHAVGINSGTAGLHLLVRACGIGPGDEVITTPFSFIASSNCILHEQARPVFVDIDPNTLCINPELLAQAVTARTKAILPVHVFGHPAEMDAIRAIAASNGLKIIEDACEALGAVYKGRPAGTMGDGAVFAFYPNKQITTGEGGMIVTDDTETARLCRSMRNHGRGTGGAWLVHEMLGFNYRLDELSAALGCSQMQRLDEILARRERVASAYHARLADVKGVQTPYVSPQVKMSWFVYVITLDPRIDRDRVMAYLMQNGVECRPYFTPLHLQPCYRDLLGYRPGDFPVTEDIARRTIALPFFNNLPEDQIEGVVAVLKEAIAHNPYSPGFPRAEPRG